MRYRIPVRVELSMKFVRIHWSFYSFDPAPSSYVNYCAGIPNLSLRRNRLKFVKKELTTEHKYNPRSRKNNQLSDTRIPNYTTVEVIHSCRRNVRRIFSEIILQFLKFRLLLLELIYCFTRSLVFSITFEIISSPTLYSSSTL